MHAFKNVDTFNGESVSDAGSFVLLVHPKLFVGVGHLVSLVSLVCLVSLVGVVLLVQCAVCRRLSPPDARVARHTENTFYMR
jgi:hypothetical protein